MRRMMKRKTRRTTMSKRTRPALIVCAALAVCSLAIPSGVAAQMTIGVKGGVNFATAGVTVSDTKLSPGTRSAYHGGAVIGMTVSRGFAIEGQVRLTGKGFEPGEPGSGVEGDLDTDYIEFPLLATFTFPREPELIAARVFAGPSLNLRASCNLVVGVDQTGFSDCDGDLSKTVDIGGVVGAGVKIGRGLGGIVVDVSYDLGFIDVTRSGDGGPDGSLYNRNFLISAGFIVPIL
jgi:hypothetical protein